MVRLRESLLFVSTYLFPILGFPLITWAWWRLTDNWAAVALVMGLPLVLGYVVPGIGTNVLKLWRFTGGWRIGHFYAHHGFIYASKMAFALLIVVRDPADLDGWEVPAAILACGAATAFGAWWHDVHAVKAGKIEVLGRDEAGMDLLLTSYEPASFLLTGVAYAAVCVYALPLLARDPAALAWVFPAALLGVALAGATSFLALDPGAFRKMTRRNVDER